MPANGLVARLQIDTTGVFSGTYALKLSDTLIGQDSDFILPGGDSLHPTIVNGTLTVTSGSWCNPADRFDVNGVQGVTPLDAVILINHINTHAGDTSLPAWPLTPPPYLDVDNDRAITAHDVLLVVNELNRQSDLQGEGETPAAPAVDFLFAASVQTEGDCHALPPVRDTAARADPAFRAAVLSRADDFIPPPTLGTVHIFQQR